MAGRGVWLVAVSALVAALAVLGGMLYQQHRRLEQVEQRVEQRTEELNEQLAQVRERSVGMRARLDELEQGFAEVALVALEASEGETWPSGSVAVQGDVQRVRSEVGELQACVNRVVQTLNSRMVGGPEVNIPPC